MSKPQKRRITDADRAKILELIDQGSTREQAAKQAGVGVSTVYSVLRNRKQRKKSAKNHHPVHASIAKFLRVFSDAGIDVQSIDLKDGRVTVKYTITEVIDL